MPTAAMHPSRYDQRVTLMQNVLNEHSTLSADETRALAIRLLRTLEAIPETIR